MTEFESRDDVVRTGDHLHKHLVKYEIIALLLIGTGIVLRLLDKPGRILITITLILLALLYFFLAFSNIRFENASNTERFVYRLNSWISSIAVIGFVFLLHRLPFATTIALVGSIPLLILTLLMLIMKNRKPENRIITLLTITRSLIIGLVVLIYYLLTIH
jgi:hypothetical protein